MRMAAPSGTFVGWELPAKAATKAWLMATVEPAGVTPATGSSSRTCWIIICCCEPLSRAMAW